MPIFEYKCGDCLSVFEHVYSSKSKDGLSCVSCGSSNVYRVMESSFYPKDLFCPREKGNLIVNRKVSTCIYK